MNSADRTIAGQEVEALLKETPPRHVETLFRNTVEDAPVGIAFIDRDGRYRHCNRAFCAMLGFDTEELRGESTASLTHGGDLQSTTAGLERLWRREIARKISEHAQLALTQRLAERHRVLRAWLNWRSREHIHDV